MKLLIISTVWIEPTSSAAGSRMLQLLNIFLEKGWELTYASTASPSEHSVSLESLGIRSASITVNDVSFDAFAKGCQPTIVLFDRFMAEEQFGWRIAEQCPDTLKILDTEDLHCLRKARELAVKQERAYEESDLVSDIAKREIAAIYRCDLTLMISRFEMKLLGTFFKVPESLLYYIPFLLPEQTPNFNPFHKRKNFIAIGNFLHTPNWDATIQLKKYIWPLIKKYLPETELHIYGAYSSDKVKQLHNPREGFLIKGRARDAQEVLTTARVLLAPLRFGAGLKGKFIDAMQSGTPSVTTQIGAEAMHGDFPWCGAVEENFDAFAKAAVHLYKNEADWLQAQQHGVAIINSQFLKATFSKTFSDYLDLLLQDLSNHRLENFTGQMLLHHTMRSTQFMSKWIEEKNSSRV